MNVYLDRHKTTELCGRLAELSAAAGPPPHYRAMGPRPRSADIALDTALTRWGVEQPLNTFARRCRPCVSARALDGRSTELHRRLQRLHERLCATTAAMVKRAQTLGALDERQGAEILRAAQRSS